MTTRHDPIGPRLRAAWATGARLVAHRGSRVQFGLARRRHMSEERIQAEFDRIDRANADEDRIASRLALSV